MAKTKGIWVAGAALIALTLTGVAGIAVAGMHRGGPHGGGGGPRGGFGDHGGPEHGPRVLLHMLSDLDLTEGQKASLKKLIADEQPRMEPLLQDAMQAHKDLFEAVHAVTADEQAIRAASARMGEARTALALEHARIMKTVRGMLSPEQLEKLESGRLTMTKKIELHAAKFHEFMWKHLADMVDGL